MRALLVTEFGVQPTLQDIDAPVPGREEVAIAVSACGLNFADLLMIKGSYQETPPVPFSPGLEVAGRISSIGEDVEGLQVGDRVAAFVGAGGLAETVTCSVDRVTALPDSMDNVTAAGFQIAYGTSHLALTRRARLQKGEMVLVLGAAGGVGRTAVEIATTMGARVVAVARGTEKLKVAAAAGAEVTIDSDQDDLLTAFRNEGPIDVVYDALGGTIGEAALRALAPEGRHLLIGFASGDLPTIKPNHLLVKNTDVIGFYWGGYLKFHPEALRDSLSELMKWHAEGRISPHVSHVLPFDEVHNGLDLLRGRKATGKVVIEI